MLSNLELATVRAALRFWLDENTSDGPSNVSIAKPYFDYPVEKALDREGVSELIGRFEASRVRCVVVDGTGRITVDRLLTLAELSEFASQKIHTVLVTAD